MIINTLKTHIKNMPSIAGIVGGITTILVVARWIQSFLKWMHENHTRAHIAARYKYYKVPGIASHEVIESTPEVDCAKRNLFLGI